jgi:hypothetical protein
MGINSWIFLKDGKPAFSHPPPSQNGWLINITNVQNVWRTMKEDKQLIFLKDGKPAFSHPPPS